MGRTSTAKQRILDSAQTLIYARSYADVGVQEICDHAGVKKGSFYHFFPSKRDLTLAVLDHMWVAFQQNLFEPNLSSQYSPLQRLQKFIDQLIAMQVELKSKSCRMQGCPFGNLALELSTKDELIRQRIDQVFEEIQAIFKEVLQEAMDKGEIPVKLPATELAQILFASLEGMILLAKTHNDPDKIRQMSQSLIQLLV